MTDIIIVIVVAVIVIIISIISIKTIKCRLYILNSLAQSYKYYYIINSFVIKLISILMCILTLLN